ncbi:unknown [Feldmannia species virus]|uniref:Uncharacterized protein n=1 Tax=Feldmannia species virus TaxID=39420 RepID=B5LWJ5_9PHYC|nr:hypothetical protein FeldSpV_gp106 [Feldmannia species virus]ACH46858.1 unknown [Feldmannia species virus]
MVVAVAYTANKIGSIPVKDILNGEVEEFIPVVQRDAKSRVKLLVKGSEWRSLLRVRGTASNNNEMVDVSITRFKEDAFPVGDDLFITDLGFPEGFHPLCYASRDSDQLFLAVIFSAITAAPFDITPVSFTLRWDLPGPVDVVLDGKVIATETSRQQIEVVNAEPGHKYLATVGGVDVDVQLPEMSPTGMVRFYQSRKSSNSNYDLRHVSPRNVEYLRKNNILGSGEVLEVRQSAQPISVVEAGTYFELSKLVQHNLGMYLVPNFKSDVTQLQSVCVQDLNSTSHVLEFDQSESFVKYKDRLLHSGDTFLMGNFRAVYVQGSILLEVSSDTAQKVETAGDLTIRDVTMRSCSQVTTKSVDAETMSYTKHLVYDPDTGVTTEFARVGHGLSADGLGEFSVDLLHSDTLVNVLSADTSTTRITTTQDDDVSMQTTFDSSGLSFDSDNGSIYFGAGKDFRIHFSDAVSDDPAMLKVQSLSDTTGEYVTRMLITAEPLSSS